MPCKIISDWEPGMLRSLFTMLSRVLILMESLYSLNISIQQTENAAESKANTNKGHELFYMVPKLLTKAELTKTKGKHQGLIL